MKYICNPLLIIIIVILSCTASPALVSKKKNQVPGTCMGIPWNSPFPVIEHSFPGIEFIEEDNFHVTLFRVTVPEKEVQRIEFKLFENKLISVILYYTGAINNLINEKYLQSLVTDLGTLQEKRKTTANSLAGQVEVEIYEYKDILVLFRYYPPGQKQGFANKQNSIVIIFKPTFNKMVYYRKHSAGDMEEIIDYDYIDF
ncbi:hypothetical protein DGMP_21190 [Desulfomarina profundi]|uniref:Lipoprotein n=1 Tax=Desulfomarina profundi TaxID=2772557 RepID=A0A8D5FIW9_9BACT|nr:hypothetical protein [Desulfomarina profundi]BCL61426.1 hypothetical protein DGMP_21190 [Desulfomarina profundi]